MMGHSDFKNQIDAKIIQIIYLRIMFLLISEIIFFNLLKYSAMFLDEIQIYFFSYTGTPALKF